MNFLNSFLGKNEDELTLRSELFFQINYTIAT